MSAPVLSLDRVERHYRSGDAVVRALDGVSLELHPGEVVGILGPSGSGKSTLLLVAGLLEPPSAGEVRIDGEPVSRPGADLDALRTFRRSHIGFIFQKANLIPFLTALENVALALQIDHVPAPAARDHAARLLEGLDLGHRLHSHPARLSGGEQQRVAVARALAPEPPILVADEPTGNLDEATGRQIMDLLFAAHRARGTTLVLVTHDPSLAARCGRVLKVRSGVIAEDSAALSPAARATATRCCSPPESWAG